MEESLTSEIDVAIDAELCKRSFYYFFIEFWETIEAVTLIPNWHIEYICNQLQEVYETWEKGEQQPDLIINVPPGSSKSTICTQLYPAWLWLKNPAIRIVSSSYSSSLSVSHAVKSRDCLKSDKFQRYFPNHIEFKEDENGKSAYKNTKKGERYTTSTGGTVTGKHGDFIIVDDPINPTESVSDKERANANNFVDKTLSSRKTDKKRTVSILIMQRLHEDDPTGNWLTKRNVFHICLPAELSDNVKPAYLKENYTDGLLDANRLDHSILEQNKEILGTYEYAGQFDQNPSPAEGGIIKKHWFQRFYLSDLPNTVRWNFVSDTAYTTDEKNDPSAILAYCFHNNNFYIRDYVEFHKEFLDAVNLYPDFCNRNGYTSSSTLSIEPKASGKSLVQTLRKITKLNVVEDINPTKDKEARLKDASPTVEGQRVYLLEGVGWAQKFIDTVCAFPNASHDEAVDCLVMMINRHLSRGRGVLASRNVVRS